MTYSLLNSLEELREKYNTPYYLYDGDSMKENAIRYMNTFREYFQGFRQFFAVKATPNPSILKLLAECGMDFDCSSPEEIKVVKMMNECKNMKSSIMYTSNFTSKEDLEFAYDQQCILNLDDIDGLSNLTKIPEIISFRYNPNLKKRNIDIQSNDFSGKKTKFGMTKNKLIEAYKRATEIGIQKFGLHTMCASNQLDISFWVNILDTVFEMISILYKDHSIKIDFLNIGGGLGIPYRPEEKAINIHEFVILLRKTFDEMKEKYELDFEPVLYTECGRYITGPYGYLVTSCKSIKETEKGTIFYGVDATMANLMRPGMYNAYHEISIPRLHGITETIKCNVVGTLCENNDWFARKRRLPKYIQKNDLFVIHDVGAHGFSMGFNYNSKLRSSEILKYNGKYECIREKETFDSLFQNTLIYKEWKKK